MKLNWRLIGLLFAATASAQMTTDMQPSGANFMQAMDVSMKRMDHDMVAALMTGEVDHMSFEKTGFIKNVPLDQKYDPQFQGWLAKSALSQQEPQSSNGTNDVRIIVHSVLCSYALPAQFRRSVYDRRR